MLALPHISAEVKRLQEKIISITLITVDSLIAELEEAREIAKERKNASALVAATALKARLKGLLIDRVEDMVERERLAADRARIGEVKKAGQLLAEAAESLDLPKQATPAQIVGAMAERTIATPETFALLRAARVTEDAAN